MWALQNTIRPSKLGQINTGKTFLSSLAIWQTDPLTLCINVFEALAVCMSGPWCSEKLYYRDKVNWDRLLPNLVKWGRSFTCTSLFFYGLMTGTRQGTLDGEKKGTAAKLRATKRERAEEGQTDRDEKDITDREGEDKKEWDEKDETNLWTLQQFKEKGKQSGRERERKIITVQRNTTTEREREKAEAKMEGWRRRKRCRKRGYWLVKNAWGVWCTAPHF